MSERQSNATMILSKPSALERETARRNERFNKLWRHDLLKKFTAGYATNTPVVPDHDANSHPMSRSEESCININEHRIFRRRRQTSTVHTRRRGWNISPAKLGTGR